MMRDFVRVTYFPSKFVQTITRVKFETQDMLYLRIVRQQIPTRSNYFTSFEGLSSMEALMQISSFSNFFLPMAKRLYKFAFSTAIVFRTRLTKIPNKYL